MSGTYAAEINRTNPACFVFLIDQSNSMADPYGADIALKKSQGVADVLNRCLQNLVTRCSRDEGVRDYAHMAIVGYTTDASGKNPVLRNLLPPALAGKDFATVSEIASNMLRLEDRTKQEYDGAGGYNTVGVKFPVWVEPFPMKIGDSGGTPICAAFREAERLLSLWTADNAENFPPIVLHITDGESTDGDPTSLAEALMRLATKDGDCLIFNCHLSSMEGHSVFFPDSEGTLPPDPFAPTLFKSSSIMPEKLRQEAQQFGVSATETTRCFVYNADIVRLIQFLDMGTKGAIR